MVQKRHSNVSEASLAGIAWGPLKARQTFIDTDKCNEHRNLFQGSDASKKREKRTMIMEPSIKINHTFEKNQRIIRVSISRSHILIIRHQAQFTIFIHQFHTNCMRFHDIMIAPSYWKSISHKNGVFMRNIS